MPFKQVYQNKKRGVRYSILKPNLARGKAKLTLKAPQLEKLLTRFQLLLKLSKLLVKNLVAASLNISFYQLLI